MNCLGIYRHLTNTIAKQHNTKGFSSFKNTTYLMNHSYYRSLLHLNLFGFSHQAQPINLNPDNLENFKTYVTNPTILSSLASYDFNFMFPIQSSAFSHILEGKDILASDRTGSGKTLAYALPAL
jgi:ATP-dependent helicase YprA (DUF1998 family)